MNCPSCGAPMRSTPNGFQCGYCHNVVVPDANDEGVSVLGDGPGDTCPVCNLPLQRAAVAQESLLYCAKCHGMLIPMDEFPTLIETLRAQQPATIAPPPADPNDLHRRIDCPHCHRGMDAHFYAGPGNVVMDSCEICDLNWLDHGELSRIARAPEYLQPPQYTQSSMSDQ